MRPSASCTSASAEVAGPYQSAPTRIGSPGKYANLSVPAQYNRDSHTSRATISAALPAPHPANRRAGFPGRRSSNIHSAAPSPPS